MNSNKKTQKRDLNSSTDFVRGQSEKGIFRVLKKRGETLAALLLRFRNENNITPETKITYAGRLDPMAEGLVILLVGDARFQKDKLLGLDKEYVMEIMLGISTDTEDVLGLIREVKFEKVSEDNIRNAINKICTIKSLPYPMYSSVPVNGKPLFMHARGGSEVDVPQKKVLISNVEILNIRNENIKNLAQDIISDVQKVEGDFRQDEIIKKWQNFLDDDHEVQLVRLKANVSSGTYMRSLAKWFGGSLGIPSLAYSIERLSVGNFDSTV